MTQLQKLLSSMLKHQLTRKCISYLSLFVPYKNVSSFESTYAYMRSIALEDSFPTEFKLLLALYGYQILKLLLTNYLSLSKLEQIIWFDYFNFIQLPRHFNLSFAFIFIQFIIFYYLVYFRCYQLGTLKALYQVLVLKQIRNVFLSSIYKGKYNIYSLIRNFYLGVINYQQVNTISLSKYPFFIKPLLIFAFSNQLYSL